MSAAVAVQTEGVRSPVALARLVRVAELVLRAEKARTALLSVTLVSRRRIAAINKRHLAHAGATDVISFGFRDPAGAVIGDVYICPEVASANAKRHGVPVREELMRLVVHGTLHVLGHEHPEGDRRTASPMWKRQERLLARALEA
ncbi:MAG: rRNA maturation RNase YbeY [Gemmatimonadetes bacterium]|nr:rRNA maturation RNase YbeY [Gemmatimonadota bacterium]